MPAVREASSKLREDESGRESGVFCPETRKRGREGVIASQGLKNLGNPHGAQKRSEGHEGKDWPRRRRGVADSGKADASMRKKRGRTKGKARPRIGRWEKTRQWDDQQWEGEKTNRDPGGEQNSFQRAQDLDAW